MGLALTLSLPAVVWGQTPHPGSPAKNQSPSAGKAEKGKPTIDTAKAEQVTVSGCLVAPGTDTGPYKLTHATPAVVMKDKGMADAKTKKDAGHKEASAKETMKEAGTSADSLISYELVGAGSDLKPHVGHKVEVTGTVHHDKTTVDKSAQTTPATGQSTQADQKMPKSAMKPLKVNVTSVKMISATCP
jgi:predicted extracellular nuclease